jgi:hypothetical protein
MPMPPEFRDLLLRFNQLGAMLPLDRDIMALDDSELVDVMLVMDEMIKVQAATNRFLEKHRIGNDAHVHHLPSWLPGQ